MLSLIVYIIRFSSTSGHFAPRFCLIKCTRNIIKNPLNSSIYAYTFVCILLKLLIKQQQEMRSQVRTHEMILIKREPHQHQLRIPIIWLLKIAGHIWARRRYHALWDSSCILFTMFATLFRSILFVGSLFFRYFFLKRNSSL